MKIIYNLLFFFVLGLILSPSALAHRNGITGQSQAGCSGAQCHIVAASAATQVTMIGASGTITVAQGAQRNFSAFVAHATQAAAGINISVKNGAGVDMGAFEAGTGLQLMNGELTHVAPQPMLGSPRGASFNFVWTAPNVPGTYTLRAAGNAVNNSDNPTGDVWNFMTPITIVVPGVQVTAPNGNEQWCRGSVRNITWTSSGMSFVNIDVSTDNGASWLNLATRIAATPSTYAWTIPAGYVPGGGYLIRVSDNSDPNTSDQSNASFYVLPTPTITEQPHMDSVCIGQSKTFSVTTDFPQSYSYQWRKNKSAISGATASTYTIASVTAASAGNYDVIVTGCNTNVASDSAPLIVFAPPSITSQPKDTTVCPGVPAQLRVAASGYELNYQWKRNGFILSSGTEATYSIAAVSESDTGKYEVVVSGRCSPPVTSTIANLKFPPAPILFSQPVDTALCVGSSHVLSVQASGAGVTYVWKKNGVVIQDINGSAYTIASMSAADSGTYSVVITNNCGFSTTASARVQLRNAPVITSATKDTTLNSGGTLILKVSATGGGLSYQWQKDGKDISKATLATLSIPNTSSADAGSYTCIVRNSCGQVTSTASVVTIKVAATAVLAYSVPGVDFGCVFPGSQRDSILTGFIQNVGAAALTVTAATIGGANNADFTLQSPSFPITLVQNQKVPVTIRFAPTSAGAKTAQLSLTSNSSGTASSVALTGQGCVTSVNIARVVFDSIGVGMTRDSVVQVCNNSTAAYVVTSVMVTGGAANFEVVTTDPLPKTIQPGACLSVTIRYKQTSTSGALGAMTVLSGGEEHIIVLEGRGTTTGVDEENTLLTSSVRAYPNPSADNVSFEVNSLTADNCSLTIIDEQGRLVYRSLNIPLIGGSNTLHWNGRTSRETKAATGSYTAIIQRASGVAVTQFMIIR
ncbi:MAG: immunoglobulin domain-containing protein [Candidatus Kapaibacterium sp.]